jgi:hypothetical protein
MRGGQLLCCLCCELADVWAWWEEGDFAIEAWYGNYRLYGKSKEGRGRIRLKLLRLNAYKRRRKTTLWPNVASPR